LNYFLSASVGFIKRIAARKKGFDVDVLFFVSLEYMGRTGFAGDGNTVYAVSIVSPIRLTVMEYSRGSANTREQSRNKWPELYYVC
jgi:hypothetical protein